MPTIEGAMRHPIVHLTLVALLFAPGVEFGIRAERVGAPTASCSCCSAGACHDACCAKRGAGTEQADPHTPALKAGCDETSRANLPASGAKYLRPASTPVKVPTHLTSALSRAVGNDRPLDGVITAPDHVPIPAMFLS